MTGTVLAALVSLAVTSDPATGLTWKRSTPESEVVVTATREGAALAQAQAEVERAALRLDALRTIRRHVVWTSIQWADGRLQVDAKADSPAMGNVAMMAIRAFYPGRSTAGSNTRPIHGAPETAPYRWLVRVLVGPPPGPAEPPPPAPASPPALPAESAPRTQP